MLLVRFPNPLAPGHRDSCWDNRGHWHENENSDSSIMFPSITFGDNDGYDGVTVGMSKCQLGVWGGCLEWQTCSSTAQLACLVIWMTCGMWTGEQGGNGTSIQRSKFRAFHNLIVRKKFGALVVVHNLFSSIESLHTSSSKHVLALKDNTARFLRLFQLRNRRGAQILLFNASTLLVRRLVQGGQGDFAWGTRWGGISRGLLTSLDFWLLFR